MKKSLFIIAASAALCAVAADKTWPANYWTVSVTNLVTAAAPSGTAVASATVAASTGGATTSTSVAYGSRMDSRTSLSFESENAVADFSSFPPGAMFIIR